MSDSKAIMHQIQFRLGLLLIPLAGFKGPTSKGRGDKEREGKEGRGRDGGEAKGRLLR